MNLRPWILTLALAVVACASANTASAQDGYNFGLGWGYSQSYFNAMRGGGGRGRIPHFALYPPVYYGQKVARPYGYSPFAAPPGVMPVEQQLVPRPQHQTEIVNPYFQPSSERPARRAAEPTPELTGPNDKTT
ncbi:MAG: hypothetical protein R3B96_09470 [Pirellulaceae bacterium]